MVNNIPVGVIKQAAAVGFHWQGKHNQQRLTALSEKMSTQGAVPVFSPKMSFEMSTFAFQCFA